MQQYFTMNLNFVYITFNIFDRTALLNEWISQLLVLYPFLPDEVKEKVSAFLKIENNKTVLDM